MNKSLMMCFKINFSRIDISTKTLLWSDRFQDKSNPRSHYENRHNLGISRYQKLC